MPPLALFGVSVAFSFIAWGIVAMRYIWPALRSQSRADALRPLLILHSFRFIGLAFLVPGVVGPDLSSAFARSAAYGDLIAAILSLLALAGLQSRPGLFLVWVFNLWGGADPSTRSIRPMPSGLNRGSWVPPTSFRRSWYLCYSSHTGWCSGSCCRVTLRAPRMTANVQPDGRTNVPRWHFATRVGGPTVRGSSSTIDSGDEAP
jgi:hypothetical protein